MSFSADVSKFVAKANGNVEKAVRQAVVLVATGVVDTTPVDTGRARANWVFGSGSINTSVNMNLFDRSGAATVARIAAQAQTQFAPVMYITNSLPYIQRLENGYSQQAPAGMVKVTLADLQRRIDRYARSLR